VGFVICIERISRCIKGKCYKKLESESLSYVIVREFLSDLKKEFREGDDEMIKAVELKKCYNFKNLRIGQ